MAERKGIHWLVWVGGGCAVLGLLVMVGVVGMGVFAAKKVADVATEWMPQLQRGEDPLQNTSAPAATHLPGFGAVDLEQWSLPMVTITLGAMNSLNPCAFFVLLFLLSLLVHAKSRARMVGYFF